MFRTAYRLPFTLLGIPVDLHISFLIILPVIAWIIGANIDEYVKLFHLEIDVAPLHGTGMRLLLGFIAAVGLFACVVIHELGHSVVGRRLGMKIRVITLWFLGGVAQFEGMPRQRGHEAIMAAAGPLTSYLLAGLFWLLLSVAPDDAPAVVFVLAYLLWMNVVLATFNLLPALPLDGGRILRSLLALRMNYLRATQTSARISKVLAFGLGVFGFLTMSIWLMLLAFFVYIAVVGESQMATVAEVLGGIRVQDLMTREVKTVPPEMTVDALLRRMMEEKHLGYPVIDGSGDLLGMVTLGNVRGHVEEGRDQEMTVRDIMSREPGEIEESASALDAFQKINQTASGRLVVVGSGGRLQGIISKTDLVRAIQLRLVEQSLDGGDELGA